MVTTFEEKSTDQIKLRFSKVRAQSIDLCSTLKTEDHVVQPVVDVSPPKWHLAHTTWFFENFVLVPHKINYNPFHKDYCYLFNSYYENVGNRVIRPNRGFMTRPTVDEVMLYREYVDQQMFEYLDNENIEPSVLDVLALGLQHEQQHQELLIYDLKHILGINPLFPSYRNLKTPECNYRGMNWLEVPEGIHDIGFEGHGFCYDNELARHKVYIHKCEIADRLVTNGEYLEFMQDGGYKKFNFWLAEAWDWVCNNQEKSPMHWHFIDGDWYEFTYGGLKPINEHAPVTHISYYEADAYARWKGLRIPTEFEWEVAAYIYQPNPSDDDNFVDKRLFSACSPVNENHYQLFGDLWEWTASAYLPYPDFKIADGAIGEYNGKFMINQMVLRGGSFATPQDHIRRTYRNFFHPHLKWLLSGIRLAR